jgi:Domain of unknown function (DUF4412)
MKLISVFLICFAFIATAGTAQAQGVLFESRQTQNGQATTNQVQMDKTHVRAETQGSGQSTVVIFDATKQVISMVNMNDKTYREMAKADLEQLKKQSDSVTAQMQDQLKNLPPQQRQIVEQMMKARGGVPGANPAASAPKAQYRSAGSDKVGQWTCTKYEGYVGQQKTDEVCTVDPKEFGLTPADFEPVHQLADFMKTLVPAAGSQLLFNGTADDQGFTGVPVRHISYQNGTAASTTEVTDVRHLTFPASTFEVPAGFSKEAFAGGRR